RHHPDCLVKGEKDDGCFSGGAFVDEDKTAYLTYWIYNRNVGPDSAQGIGLARALPPYDHWEQLPRPIVSSTRWGILDTPNGQHIGCADPSNIWKNDGVYYLQTGNKPVLDAHGRSENAPRMYRGDWTELFTSPDLRNWEYKGRFYHRFPGGPDDSEDDMCASFLPLPASPEGGVPTDAYLQLFISHNRGCQYYIGSWEKETFTPRLHGRMSWVDDTYFAPEAALDGQGRQIAFAWLRDDLPGQMQTYGWTGVFGLPRSLWLREDGTLGISPVRELQSLRGTGTVHETGICRGETRTGTLSVPDSCEIRLEAADVHTTLQLRLMIRENGDAVTVSYDPDAGILAVDGSKSGSLQRAVREEAPLSPEPDGTLSFTVYIDKSVIEVFAGERQAITRRIYNPAPVLNRMEFRGNCTLTQWKSWPMMQAMPY
ncbi:MAG: glycoside hydrolase family 32 protein, partial [Clostridia bacterium]|nr:glycoside hydrolase family 32 protein [Clostridia bacterium]